MTKGTVKHLVTKGGYGFIQTEEWPDILFDRNDLRGVTYESLTTGQEVEFEITPTSKGPKAVNVRLAE